MSFKYFWNYRSFVKRALNNGLESDLLRSQRVINGFFLKLLLFALFCYYVWNYLFVLNDLQLKNPYEDDSTLLVGGAVLEVNGEIDGTDTWDVSG